MEMNQEERKKRINENWMKYHHPGGTALTGRIKRNVIYLRTGQAGSKRHEMKKCEICYDLQREGIPFITESVRNKKENGKDRRVDIVNLVTGDEIEIETNHTIKKSNCTTVYI